MNSTSKGLIYVTLGIDIGSSSVPFSGLVKLNCYMNSMQKCDCAVV